MAVKDIKAKIQFKTLELKSTDTLVIKIHDRITSEAKQGFAEKAKKMFNIPEGCKIAVIDSSMDIYVLSQQIEEPQAPKNREVYSNGKMKTPTDLNWINNLTTGDVPEMKVDKNPKGIF